MPTREAAVYERLKERICTPKDRFERIENGLGTGMPDTNYCFFGKEGWIEIKAPILPARAETGLFTSQHGISIEQSNWFLAQQRAGGRAFVFVATKERLLLLPPSIVIEHRKVNALPLKELESFSVWSAPVPCPMELWIELRVVLMA